jgi:peptidoglycan/LPS O-acetylase OafA/YrhL
MLDWFAIGMLLAVLASDWEKGARTLPRLAALSLHPWCCWLLGIECFALVVVTSGDPFLPQYGFLMHIALGVTAGLFVLAAVGPVQTGVRSRAVRALRSPVMAWLGMVSFGIYLWHVPLLEALRGPISSTQLHPTTLVIAIGVLLVTTLGAVAFGAASWYLVERPARRLLRRTPKPTALPANA